MNEGAQLVGRIIGGTLALLVMLALGLWVLWLVRRPAWWIVRRVGPLVLWVALVWVMPRRATRMARGLWRAGNGARVPPGGKGGYVPAVTVQRAAPRFSLKALSAQKIATGKYADTQWLVYGLLARGVITLLAADAKAGKTELLFGMIRACFDRKSFCGLDTTPMKVLILSEQAPSTLSPFVRRWGFYVDPHGRLDALRQEYLPPRGAPGHVVRIVSWGQLYGGRSGDERPTWADVAPRGIAMAVKGKYDLLVIDTLGRWAVGEDGSINSGATMLKAMGSLHEAAEAGLSVLVNHHNSRAGNIMGSVAVEGEVDVILQLSKAPAEGEDEDLTTRRQLRGKGRYQETPGAMLLRLVRRTEALPGEPTALYEEASPVLRALAPPPKQEPPKALPKPKEASLSKQQAAVLAALQSRKLLGATVADLAHETNIPRQRAGEAVKALLAKSLVFQRGTVPVQGGGQPAARYIATACLLTMKEDTPIPPAEDVG